jgi:peptide/nickel transport system permease protein
MLKLAAGRLLAALPLMFLVATMVFVLVQANPVDPAEVLLGQDASDEAIAATRARLGVDRPLTTQYVDWLTGAVRGDLGNSWFSGESVMTDVARRVPVTLSLVFGSLLVSLALGVALGVAAAVRAGRKIDRGISVAASAGLAAPNFWVALLLAYLFSVRFGWFPAVGYTGITESPVEWARHLVLPCIALGTSAAASIFRQTRSSMIGVLQQDYIRTSLAKGMSRRTVIMQHALRNAAIPIVTLAGFQVSTLFGGAIFVEQVFNMPGLGSMGVDAVIRNNVPVVLAFVMVTALVVVLVNIVLDLLYAWLNPKVRPA